MRTLSDDDDNYDVYNSENTYFVHEDEPMPMSRRCPRREFASSSSLSSPASATTVYSDAEITTKCSYLTLLHNIGNRL